MAFIRVLTPPNVTAEIYDRVNALARPESDPPAGLLFHCAGEVDGNWQIVDAWESQEHAERFDEERLIPAIEKVQGMRPPGPPPGQRYEAYRVIKP